MHGDERFSRFFAYLNLFVFSMLMLVLGSSFLVTFLGWEGVGLCSYLLISFWFERNAAAVAGKKAFVTNRVGDVGFLLAMFLIFASYGIAELRGDAPPARTRCRAAPRPRSRCCCCVAAVGKSAQIPLHLWLPDAMEGPTPVSALIHAATMVTAGVFLLCRAHAFLDVSGDAMTVVAWVGGITALLAGTGRDPATRHQTRARVLHRQPARATCSSPSGSARTPPRCSWCCATRSTRAACSSAPAR